MTEAIVVKEVIMPAGVSEEIIVKATEIVTNGVKEGKDDDAMKQAVFALGVPFSKLNLLYNAILKKEGLSVDVKIVKSSIDELIAKSGFTLQESFEELKNVAQLISENVKDSSVARVMAQMKKYWVTHETEFPRKPATKRKAVGYINTALIEMFLANPKTTVEELAAEFAKNAKTPETALSYAKQYHPACFAIANKMTVLQAATALAKMAEAEAPKAVASVEDTPAPAPTGARSKKSRKAEPQLEEENV